ncbi:MAG: trypsin-like peptidase domain-containing protein [Nocardiaceae bacterium]|nr:trypsin-like peptidase domain-containing protein [Nocardiaceae bacterium]
MIRVETGGQVLNFDGGRPVRLGRNLDSEVVLNSALVSRTHAELVKAPEGWTLRDLGGPNGTWIDEHPISQAVLGPATKVRFGPPEHGVNATITVLPDVEAGFPFAPPAEPDLEKTLAGRLPLFRPALLVSTKNGDRLFEATRPVRIGRDPNSDVVANNPVVSRAHATVEPRPDGWWFVNQSSSGSYIDGEEVQAIKLTGRTELYLGHPTGGYHVELASMVAAAVAQKEVATRKRKNRKTSHGVKIGMALMTTALVGIGGAGGFVLYQDSHKSQPVSAAALLETAKKATVEIIAYNANGVPLWHGSGSIIDSSGLILTNAHVAAPNVPGSREHTDLNATEYRIALRQSDDRPTVPTFKATTIVSDGYLDLAVMKITGHVDGSAIKAGEIPAPIPLGDSSKLNTGDPITALGYPGLSDDDPSTVESPLTVTRGSVSTLQTDPLTKTPRAWIDSDVRLASGNSGGGSINADGQLIGINSAVRAGRQGSVATFSSSMIRPISMASEVIRIARAGGDTSYTSPALRTLPSVKAAGWSLDGEANCNGASSLTGVKPGGRIYAEFQVERIPNDMPTAVEVDGVVGGQAQVLGTDETKWSKGPGSTCIVVSITVPAGVTDLEAYFAVGPRAEVMATNPVTLEADSSSSAS